MSLSSIAGGQTGDPLDVRVTLSVKNKKVSKVLNHIRQHYRIQLVYPSNIDGVSSPLSFSLKEADIRETMNTVLRTSPFVYVIESGVVIVRDPVKKNVISTLTPEDLNVAGPQAWLKDINGRITDRQGRPLQGASIQVSGTTKGTFTNESGRFELKGLEDNAVLLITMTGYRQKTVTIADNPLINVVLEEDFSNLDQVVVTGYGTQNRRSLTGAISSVKGKDIENIPLQSLDKALQGKAAGVLVQTLTGVPGGAVRINIRGVGSITAGTEPMYIVDGVQLNSDAPSDRTSTNVLAYINPNDIESIEILKDAAAAAIYGSQAANGVVLITTKKGRAGKANFTLNYYEGISSPVKNLDVLSSQDAIAMRTEALMNANPGANYEVMKAQALTDMGVSPDLTDEEIAALPTYDWQKETFKTGHVRNIEFSASGGTDKSTFYISAGYNKHEGNVTGIDFEKGTARFRLGQQLTKRFNIDAGLNISLITQNGNTGSAGSTNGSASPQYTAAYMPPTVPIYNPDGSFNAYEGMPGTGFNPIQAATVDDNIVKHRALLGNLTATYKILDNLTFKSFYGIDYRYVRSDYYRDPRTPNGAPWGGYLIDDNAENINFTTNQTLNYSTRFGEKHGFSAMVGAEYRSDLRESESARGNGFPTYQFRTNQSAAEAYSVTGAWSGFRKVGFFGQANYEFDRKYFVSGVLRYDGSSRFGANNRMGFFPGISFGWDLSREEFIDKLPWIEQLKLRVGYGITGNDQINNVSSRGFYQGGSSYNSNAAIFLQTIANPDLQWEGNISTNIGLDYSLFTGRINGTVEVYHRRSKNLILSRPVPASGGFSSINMNLGEVVNKGLELTLNTVNVKAGNFTWSSNFNIAFLQNEVTKLYGDEQFLSNTIRLGYPLSIWYRYRYAGVNAANGRPMWYDKNGNVTYQVTADDLMPTKKGWQSDYFGGFTNTFTYKGFELNTLFHFDMGRYIANDQYAVFVNVMNNPGRNTLEELYADRWTTVGQVTTVPRLIAGGAERNSSAQTTSSNRMLQDGSFIRLREVTLAYQFQQAILDKLKLSRIRVYFTAVNLATWTKWVGYDPEFAIYGSVGGNQGLIPQTMSFTGGIQLGF